MRFGSSHVTSWPEVTEFFSHNDADKCKLWSAAARVYCNLLNSCLWHAPLTRGRFRTTDGFPLSHGSASSEILEYLGVGDWVV